MVKTYIPKRGDIVWITLHPVAGHEDRGRRPSIVLCIVLSEREYNKRAGLMVVCPITSHEKGYPFEVLLSSKKMKGVVLSDHVHSLDWRKRHAVKIAAAPSRVLLEVQEKLKLLFS